MRISFFLFFFLLLPNLTNSQISDTLLTKDSDSIRKQIQFIDESNLETIISLSNQLYETALRNKDPQNMIDALKYLSIAKLNSGNNFYAIEYLNKAISIANEYTVDKKTVADLIKLKGNHFFDIEEYDKAAVAYNKALKISRDIDYQYGIWALYTNLGFVKLRTGDPSGALRDLKKSISLINNIANKGSDLEYRSLMLDNARVCEAYIKLNQLDSALIANDKGLKYTLKTKIDNIHIDLLMHRGIIYMHKKEYPTAIGFLNQATSLCHKANDIVFLGKILNLKAECNYLEEKYLNSIEILHESLKILNNNYSNSDELSQCYKLLGQSYKRLNNLEKSNLYYEKYILSLTKLNSKKSHASQKVTDILLDDYESEIYNLENQKQWQKHQLTYFQIGLVVFGAALILILFFFQRSKIINKNKFDILLDKIEKSETTDISEPETEKKGSNIPIIDTADETLKSHPIELDISNELYEHIIQKLKEVETQKYYLKKECNLYNVTKKVGTNTSYLSKIINSHFGKNFNTYINDLRINYTILRLKNDPKFRSYSIKSIAEEVGYKSADSFTKYFKIHTGLLPSFYIKKLNSP